MVHLVSVKTPCCHFKCRFPTQYVASHVLRCRIPTPDKTKSRSAGLDGRRLHNTRESLQMARCQVGKPSPLAGADVGVSDAVASTSNRLDNTGIDIALPCQCHNELHAVSRHLAEVSSCKHRPRLAEPGFIALSVNRSC